jgi:hypothetical protein
VRGNISAELALWAFNQPLLAWEPLLEPARLEAQIDAELGAKLDAKLGAEGGNGGAGDTQHEGAREGPGSREGAGLRRLCVSLRSEHPLAINVSAELVQTLTSTAQAVHADYLQAMLQV